MNPTPPFEPLPICNNEQTFDIDNKIMLILMSDQDIEGEKSKRRILDFNVIQLNDFCT